jgi:cytochrome P450
MLGIPVRGQARTHELTGTLARGLEPLTDPGLQAAIRSANDELTGIVRDLAAWKRANPGDDLFSALIDAADDGDRLTEDELIAQVMFIYIAGHETTSNLIAGGILSLLRNPGELSALHRAPGLAANAVEELLRYDSPVHLMRRVSVEPLTVADTEIPAGSWLVAALAAANRDQRFWGADADDLRLARPNAHQHVSFGAGAHHCLGSGLARLEAEVTFARFAARFPEAQVEDLRWNGRINVRGLSALTITAS